MERTALTDLVRWGAVACLRLHSEVQHNKPIELFRGQMADVVHVALARLEEERTRLFISYEGIDHELAWIEIVELSARPDFPVRI